MDALHQRIAAWSRLRQPCCTGSGLPHPSLSIGDQQHGERQQPKSVLPAHSPALLLALKPFHEARIQQVSSRAGHRRAGLVPTQLPAAPPPRPPLLSKLSAISTLPRMRCRPGNMPISQLVAVLESLPQHFSAAAASKKAAGQAAVAARLLHEAALAASPSDIADAWGRLLERWGVLLPMMLHPDLLFCV